MQDRDDCERDRFRALYDQHYAAVLRYAARRVGAETGRDITAETFLTAWRRLDSVPRDNSLPWLYATARKCLANELRRQGRREQLDARIRTEAGSGLGMAHPAVADVVAGRLAVLAALATLGPNDQEALRLTEWEQLDYAMAAQAMGCSAGTFRVRLHRARRRFARALSRQAAPPDGSLARTTSTPPSFMAETEARP
ncbi:MAG TPA: RNA polymerase sigma factor [Streptosporangiaceae bacterium]|nr:RNA polymerase sigma factor [Streptosporangiaceae bacterium]